MQTSIDVETPLDQRIALTLGDELGLLGKQIILAMAAYERPEDEHACAVQVGQPFKGKDLFTSTDGRKFLVYDSLPGNVNVMAIGVDARSLFVELSPYDPDGLDEGSLPQSVRINAEGMWLERRKLANVVTASDAVSREHGPRQLWMIPWKKLSVGDLAAAIFTLDAIDAHGAYFPDPRQEPEAPMVMDRGRRPTLELRMSIQLQLIAVQVPVLAQRTKLRGDMELGMDQRIEQVLRFERWLMRNPEEAIEHWLTQDASPESQQRLAQMIDFKLARDVKSAAASQGMVIAWREARAVVRRLQQRQTRQSA